MRSSEWALSLFPKLGWYWTWRTKAGSELRGKISVYLSTGPRHHMFVLHMTALVRAATPLTMRLCCSPQLPLIVDFFTDHSSIKTTASASSFSVYPKTIHHLKCILWMGERCLPFPKHTSPLLSSDRASESGNFPQSYNLHPLSYLEWGGDNTCLLSLTQGIGPFKIYLDVTFNFVFKKYLFYLCKNRIWQNLD